VSDRARLAGARLVRGASRRPSVTEQHLACKGVPLPARVGSLALRICQVAAGAFDFTYSADFRGGPWDLCGPLAILTEAGGTVSDLSGRPVRVSPAPADLPRTLVVSNGRLHDAVLRALADRPR
jgi:fructose-1,6-bisphosphatase/inositol monophosphatase family enzyme